MTYTMPDPIFNGIIRDADGANIPADPANRDWREYQDWLAAGNTPNPYVVPPRAVPQTVSMLNARRALRAAGVLDKVEALIAQQSPDVQDGWALSTTLDRNSPTVVALGAQLGLDLDALFISAAALPRL